MPAIFNKEQEEAITHKEGPLMVLAGPGSGKTLVITYRVKWLIENAGVHPSNILVITFTRAAAEEMRKRFFAFDGMENAPFKREERYPRHVAAKVSVYIN